MSDLEKIQQRIAVLKEELAECETAARVLRRLAREEHAGVGRNPRPRGRLEAPPRMTILEAAKAILAEKKGELHFSVVADEAIARGYKGKKTSAPDAIHKSFWATMKRNPAVFEAVGAGKFKLKKQATP
jgi:hypothetical protein